MTGLDSVAQRACFWDVSLNDSLILIKRDDWEKAKGGENKTRKEKGMQNSCKVLLQNVRKAGNIQQAIQRLRDVEKKAGKTQEIRAKLRLFADVGAPTSGTSSLPTPRSSGPLSP